MFRRKGNRNASPTLILEWILDCYDFEMANGGKNDFLKFLLRIFESCITTYHTVFSLESLELSIVSSSTNFEIEKDLQKLRINTIDFSSDL